MYLFFKPQSCSGRLSARGGFDWFPIIVLIHLL